MLKRLLIILLLPIYGLCQSYPAKPSNYVTDEASVLGPDEEYRLNAILKAFEDSTSIQLFVYTAKSLNGAVMADLCQDIFHNWKIGEGKKNNGVLIGIFVDDHKFRIHTGYGMEGVLPDLRTKKIQDEIMRPYFKENNYFMGIVEGVNKIVYYSKHEFVPSKNDPNIMIGFLIVYAFQFVIFMILCLVLFKNFKGTPKAKNVLFILGIVALLIPFLGIIALIFLSVVSFLKGRVVSRSYGSGYDNGSTWQSSSWSSSDSSSSYDSGSSFSGGGGGDSGGGGSDSSW